jgi:hypothetical protein
MNSESPHATFREAYAYVLGYFEQLARLLADASSAMEKQGFSMLRPNGDTLVGGPSASVGRADTWISSWLFAFYAPFTAFGGYKYGVPVSAACKVPFIGVGFYGPEVELPAVYMGWVAPLDITDANVETRLASYYGAVEPAKLTPTPDPVQSVDNVVWTPAAHATERVRVALARVPMELITGPKVIDQLVTQLVAALRSDPG